MKSREGSIVNDNSYTGLILRQETAVNAEAGGYISYYQNGNSKVKSRHANLCTVSTEAEYRSIIIRDGRLFRDWGIT